MASSSSSRHDPVNISLLTDLIFQFHMLMHFQCDTIIHLSHTQDVKELDWLLCLFTACDPYLESECQFDQSDYQCYITYLVDPATWVEEEDSDEMYELNDKDFIALDEDRGFHLGLPPGLYDILFPRERPFVFPRRG